MTPILATDYGNLYSFLLGVPLLLLALLLVVLGARFRLRGLHLAACVSSLIAALLFFYSLVDVRTIEEENQTKFLAWSAVVFALLTAPAAHFTRRRPAVIQPDDSNSNNVA